MSEEIEIKPNKEKCKDKTVNGFGDYTDKQYAEMEDYLSTNINNLLDEIQNKYCVIPIVELELKETTTEVNVWILNRYVGPAMF